MFEVEYKGGNGVVIASKKTTLFIDPKLSLVGLKDLVPKNAIELGTESRLLVNSPDATLIIEGPGEYEVGDFTLKGVAAVRHIDTEDDGKASTIYRLECGDIRLAVIGNIADKLSDEQYEAIGVVDIVILPVGGGGYTLDPTSAAGIVRSIEPKVVIPIHYAESGLRYEVPQESLDVFTKELGAPVESMGKVKLKSQAALPPALTVYELARS